MSIWTKMLGECLQGISVIMSNDLLIIMPWSGYAVINPLGPLTANPSRALTWPDF